MPAVLAGVGGAESPSSAKSVAPRLVTSAMSVVVADSVPSVLPSPPAVFADGTNHSAQSSIPAAMAVSSGRRAMDTMLRSPLRKPGIDGYFDANERSGSREIGGPSALYAPAMSTPETSRYVRLRVDLVLEIDGPEALSEAAVGRIDADPSLPAEDRTQTRAAVDEDAAEALAYLVDPFDLVATVPGVELVQASWSSEDVEYDPDAGMWDLDEGLDEDDDTADDSDDEEEDEEEEGEYEEEGRTERRA